ncbi:hypothetical protein MARLIPOL_02335 [Marinobacter lipolyticus SM19]|uniref:NAD/FAD-utilizing enzyme apparently involved in cell division n=1 Tax=Marinobacter lipolyticus SM19 TaxID=1318628 RepID=R8B5D7_9GAMM|nr:hypothetical protein [Marinobacter lipolyticus]EON93724.1 hypothetical protein MARLIPOL_02335 [Marinobacter lipolyticus SM19]
MKRLFYLVDSIDSVQNISDDLHQRGVTDWRFHIVSKDEAGLYTHRLHSASVLDKTDLPRFVERGMLIGALFALFFVVPLALWGGLEWPMAAYVAMGAFAIIAGGWLGGFGGISTENYRIRKFHGDIEAGRYLVMVDVPKKHVSQMEELMALNHPEAELQGEGSSFNNPLAGADGKIHVVH